METRSRRSFLALGASLAAGALVESGPASASSQAPMPKPPDLAAVVLERGAKNALLVKVATSPSVPAGTKVTLVATSETSVWSFAPPGDLRSFDPGDEVVAAGEWRDATFAADYVSPLFDGVQDEIESVRGYAISVSSGVIVDASAARTSFDTTTNANLVDISQAAAKRTLRALVQRNTTPNPKRAYVVEFS